MELVRTPRRNERRRAGAEGRAKREPGARPPKREEARVPERSIAPVSPRPHTPARLTQKRQREGVDAKVHAKRERKSINAKRASTRRPSKIREFSAISRSRLALLLSALLLGGFLLGRSLLCGLLLLGRHPVPTPLRSGEMRSTYRARTSATITMVVALFKRMGRIFSRATFAIEAMIAAIAMMKTRSIVYRSVRALAICGHSSGCNSR